MGGVAHRLIGIFQIRKSGDHARCGSVDERQHSTLPAGRDHVRGARDVGSVEVGAPASRPYLCGGVKDDVDPTGGVGHRFGIRHIPLILVDTVGGQRRVLSTGEASDVISPLPEGPGDGSPNEAACSGHQCLHEWVSISRPASGGQFVCWPTRPASRERSWRCGEHLPERRGDKAQCRWPGCVRGSGRSPATLALADRSRP